MGQCTFCGTETNVDNAQTPICIKCSHERESNSELYGTDLQTLNDLIQDLLEAATRKREAYSAFETAISQFPSGLPYPNGAELLENTSIKLSVARKAMRIAQTRLNDFRTRRSAPKSYQRSA